MNEEKMMNQKTGSGDDTQKKNEIMAGTSGTEKPSTSEFSRLLLEKRRFKKSISPNGPVDVRLELMELVRARAVMAERVATLDHEIYDAEGDYLGSTDTPGNIIKGWNFNPALQSPSVARGMKRKASRRPDLPHNQHQTQKKFKESDRLFSRSSVTTRESLEKYMVPSTNNLDQDRTNSPVAHYLIDHSYPATSSSFASCGSDVFSNYRHRYEQEYNDTDDSSE